MRLEEKTAVFNVSDTNGRRDDIVDAYKIYLDILYELQMKDNFQWKSYPKSFAQFEFYEKALELSKGVFNEHKPYDELKMILNNRELRNAFENKQQKSEIRKISNGDIFLKRLDQGAEKRARHYTTTLVKMGFCNNQRIISNIGLAYLKEESLERDDFEYLLPINDINLILLRQCLKMKVYTHNYENSYSPFLLLLYVVYKIDRPVSSKDIFEIINSISPYSPVDIDEIVNIMKNQNKTVFIDNYNSNFIEANISESSLFNISDIKRLFRSKKSNNEAEIALYYDFYIKLYSLVKERTEKSYKDIKELFQNKQNNSRIKKTFNAGKTVFNFKNNNIDNFFEDNKNSKLLQLDEFNLNFYREYRFSKRKKDIHDFSDMLKRVARATGIIEIKNGLLSLDNKDVWEELLAKVDFEKLIFQSENPDDARIYENQLYSKFYNHISLSTILDINAYETKSTVNRIQSNFHLSNSEDLKLKLIDSKNEALIKLINDRFTKEKVLEILALFEDRNNDKKIHEMVGSDANIPTIYEYMIGIAWYYLSAEKYNVFNSFNLTMNANFLPETHAGGGAGDIVIEYKDHTLMLEVTLMNKNAQKRGEWEPVLRHATNLTINEDPRKVRTLFIADELDENTINIWRAVASVPLMSTSGSKDYAEHVVIMPLETKEIIQFIQTGVTENQLFNQIDSSYQIMKSVFDKNWRIKILNNI